VEHKGASLQAALDSLSQKPANAEQRLLQAGLVDDAISAHLDCQRWEDAIRVAEEAHHPDQERLRKEYMEHLLSTKQLEQAGRVKEGEGDIQVQFHACAITCACDGTFFVRVYHAVMINHQMEYTSTRNMSMSVQ
jgi:uncharacterized protein YqiB (DUF1249 family)